MAAIRTQVSGPVVMLWCDVGGALAIAAAQGHDPRAMAWLLAHIAAGVDEAAAARLEETARETPPPGGARG